MDKWSTVDVINTMIENESYNDTQNLFFCEMVLDLTEKYPDIIKYNIPPLMKSMINKLQALKKNVVVMAEQAVEKILISCGNKDIVPFIPEVIKAIKDVQYTDESIEKLAGCIFVQNIEYPTLSVMLPILQRGLRSRKTETKRKTCVIIENMCKLIEHPKEIFPLLPELEPMLEECSTTISEPEARDVALRTYNFVQKTKNINFEYKEYSNQELEGLLKEAILDSCVSISEISYIPKLDKLAEKVNYMLHTYTFDEEEWNRVFAKYLTNCSEEQVMKVSTTLLNSLKNINDIKEERYVDTEEGEDLYSGEFSLAYGSLTLLNNTFLHLKKNRFYGLLGPNNCGKTTLMRAIANEQVEGFPTRDVLKTIFVEHEIQEREVGEDEAGYPIFNTDLNGIDWVVECCNDFYHMEPKVTREQVEEVMQEIGFGNSKKYPGMERAADAEMPVTTYSGGWKMKMQLCAATLMDADILMLDEPTGHLDVDNIAWLRNFLTGFREKGGSIICTSHDSAFLNIMCTHIVDFQNRKLVVFREPGENLLEKFVAKFPEKQGYFELKNDVIKFDFPEPGLLDGKKGNKPILRMTDVTFQYPIRDKPTVTNISLQCSLSSRVAVIGPNGAGKSTAIKLLIGELKPTSGEIWKNTSARIAYVAQHAFQHLEKHLTQSATQYILWRFAGNIDREHDDFVTEEEETVRQKYCIENENLQYVARPAKTPEQLKRAITLGKILSRKDNKKLKIREYEITCEQMGDEVRFWVTQRILEEMGNMNEVNRFEEHLAAQQGLMNKSLTVKNVEKHLAGFGIDAETATHTRISSLSGGQKVKVVLAASMWMNPHLLILDEPTNYLDRDGLGALTKAIEEFKGGVVIISHNREFANAVATEKWIMERGCLRKEGESTANQEAEAGNGNDLIQSNDVFVDGAGNEIKIQKKEGEMDKREMKKQLKTLQKELKTAKKLKEKHRITDLECDIDMLKMKIKETTD
jgi:elongation factor 3